MSGNSAEEEHEVYGGEIPDFADTEPNNFHSSAADNDIARELEEMKRKLRKMEEETALLREMQSKAEKEISAAEDSDNTEATQAEKEDADNRSIFVNNVHFACTVEEVQNHFQNCGMINRTTLLTDKFGKPKGLAYVEFAAVEGVEEALKLNESVLHDRQLKVMPKRTNVPGMKHQPHPRYRPHRRPQYYSPYGYGKAPRHRGPPVWYMPY